MPLQIKALCVASSLPTLLGPLSGGMDITLPGWLLLMEAFLKASARVLELDAICLVIQGPGALGFMDINALLRRGLCSWHAGLTQFGAKISLLLERGLVRYFIEYIMITEHSDLLTELCTGTHVQTHTCRHTQSTVIGRLSLNQLKGYFNLSLVGEGINYVVAAYPTCSLGLFFQDPSPSLLRTQPTQIWFMNRPYLGKTPRLLIKTETTTCVLPRALSVSKTTHTKPSLNFLILPPSVCQSRITDLPPRITDQNIQAESVLTSG